MNVLFHPYEEPVTRPHLDRRLDVQVPPSDFLSQLPNLLPDSLAHLLSHTLRLQKGGIGALADFNPSGEKRCHQGARQDSSPVTVHLVPKPRCALAVVAFEAAY